MDIGQVEGGFVMGMGQWLTENVKYDPECGRPVTDGTWVNMCIILFLLMCLTGFNLICATLSIVDTFVSSTFI